jgi:predicted nucleic acid-binding protein
VIRCFDSNILIYAIDSRGDARHRVAASALARAIRDRAAVVPLQALGEFYHVTTRKLGLARATARRFVDGWARTTRVEPYGEDDLGAAMRACEDHGLSFWDALIWAVAERTGAAFLVTEDLQPGRRLGRVTFIDPFDPANRAMLGIDRA